MPQIDLSGAYTIPSKVYVGDRANLVLPLPGIAADAKINSEIPSSAEIIIHNIAIERRPGNSYLTVEFSAYAPGILELPPIEIEGEVYTGFSIEISSILAPGVSGVLSSPALPLAIPGTSLLIYGSMGTVILLILAAMWALFWGRRRMMGWLAAWKRKRLLLSMLKTERHLRRALERGTECREILDVLSTEFRNFLACFTGENYRAMTAAEISGHSGIQRVSGEILGGFFSKCDAIRFNGGEINDKQALMLLGDLRGFLAGMKPA